MRNDEDCPRCGWTAPGPKGDALADASRASDALAAARGWSVIAGCAPQAHAA